MGEGVVPMEQTVIAVDPGREKCGVAVVHQTQGVLHMAVVSAQEISAQVSRLATDFATTILVLGDGTAHHNTKTELEQRNTTGKPFTIHLIDEMHSTEEARQRYWQHNPPTGLRRLIPLGLQVPPVPVDGYVAVILAERFFKTGTRD